MMPTIPRGNDSSAQKRPLPLHRDLPEPEPYPVDALGPHLAPVARALGASIQAPLGLCAQSLLAAANLAVQAHANAVVDGRVHALSSFFVTIGESGERKTAVDREALRAHRHYEKGLMDSHRGSAAAFLLEEAIWSKERDVALRLEAQDRQDAIDALGNCPEPPLLPFLIAEEPTYEGLVKLLANGQPSIGLFTSEGGRLIGGYGMSQDHLLKMAAGLSELWDGDRIGRVRAADGASALFGRRLAMHIMAQPGVATKLVCNPVLTDQGLVPRLLILWPTSTIGTRLYREVDLSTDPSLCAYQTRIASILNAPMPIRETTRNELEPRALVLDPRAKAVWIKAHDLFETQLKGPLAPIRGFGSKAAEHVLRLAGTLALLANIDAGQLEVEHVTMGIGLVEHYLSEALRLHSASIVDPDLVLASKVLDWARANGRFHLAQLYQFGPTAVRDAKTARRIVDILVEHCWLLPLPEGTELGGAKRKHAWEVTNEPV